MTATAPSTPVNADDDFRPIQGTSLATAHRQWLDQGLPAKTWLTYLAAWHETQPTPVVAHTHIGDQCYPACRRWGTR